MTVTVVCIREVENKIKDLRNLETMMHDNINIEAELLISSKLGNEVPLYTATERTEEIS